jgi:hypothetical protein
MADATVVAQLNAAKVPVGTAATLSINVFNAADNMIEGRPSLQVDGLDIEGPISRGMININGFERLLAPVQFQLTPTREGEFTIPPIEVKVAGQIHKTNELKLTAVEQKESDFAPIVEIVPTKKEVWEGELMPVSINLYVHQSAQLQELPLPNLAREGFAMKRFERRNSAQGVREINGVLYREFVYSTVMHALKPGELTLGPAELKVELWTPSAGGRRDPFGGVFGNQAQQTFQAKSIAVPIKVKPLPTAGRPANFNGVVGEFQVSVQAQPMRLTVNDPLTALLIVQGTGNFETLVAPELETTDGWRTYDAKVVQENRAAGTEVGGVVFSQVIEPQKIHKELPPFALSFFNPTTGQYQTAKSPAVPLSILPEKAPVAAVPGATAGTPMMDFGNRPTTLPSESLRGMLAIMPTASGWITPTPASTTANASATMGLSPMIHGIPAGLLALICLFGLGRKIREKSAASRIKDTAPPKAAEILRQLKSCRNSPKKFYATAAEFLAAWEREKNTQAPASIEAVSQIRLRRDFYGYSHSAVEQPVPEAEANAIYTALAKL